MIYRFTDINDSLFDSGMSDEKIHGKTRSIQNRIEQAVYIDQTPKFIKKSFKHISSNCWSLKDFLNCLLVTEWFTTFDENQITDGDEYYRSGRKYTYLVEPVYEDKHRDRTKLLRYTLINSTEQISELMEYLRSAKLIPLSDDDIKESWTGCISKILLDHLKRNQLSSELIINEFNFHLADINKLVKANYSSNGLKRLAEILATERLKPVKSTYQDEPDYSDDELRNMYRAAYENDPDNLWNND